MSASGTRDVGPLRRVVGLAALFRCLRSGPICTLSPSLSAPSGTFSQTVHWENAWFGVLAHRPNGRFPASNTFWPAIALIASLLRRSERRAGMRWGGRSAGDCAYCNGVKETGLSRVHSSSDVYAAGRSPNTPPPLLPVNITGVAVRTM